MIVINRTPSTRQLRQFAGVGLVFFGALGGWLSWAGHSPVLAAIFWAAAAIVGLGGLVSTSWARMAYFLAVYVTYPIGLVLSWVNLVIIYFVVLTPVALVLRAFGRDALTLKFDARRASYWHPRPGPPEPQRYFEQF